MIVVAMMVLYNLEHRTKDLTLLDLIVILNMFQQSQKGVTNLQRTLMGQRLCQMHQL
jgi:hypothetical protein